ncbi:hypothetical protein ACEWY4_002364 [Coilia grayii]|uniref:C1q domain-containing protein n=1 Tax=Coilia grayii TaxID=363190 RepID=A0ABD1KN52_9TELE
MELKAALVVIFPLMCHITPILSNDDEVEQSSAPCPGPRAVHFYAANPSPIDGHMDPIPFPDVTVNVGFAFSGASGIFTAPVNGIYRFFFSTQSGPRAVHFYAAHPSEIDGYVDPIHYTDVTLNVGFAFSGASGIFTAPVNGIYQFFFSFQSARSNVKNNWRLKVNGVSKVLCHSQVNEGDTVGNMCTYMAALAQNDRVTVSQERGQANMELKAALVVIFPLMCHITPILSNDDEVEQSCAPCPGPRAVHFYAANPSPIDGHMDPIPFPDVTVNVGFAFSGASGIFTAPVNGIYRFFFSTQSGRNNMNNLWYLKVNGVSKVACLSQVSQGNTVGSMCTYMSELAQNDKVTVSQMSGYAWNDDTSRSITFSGSLLLQKSNCPCTAI